MNDWYESIGHEIQIRPITRAEFYNTVIYGTLAGDEINLILLTMEFILIIVLTIAY